MRAVTVSDLPESVHVHEPTIDAVDVAVPQLSALILTVPSLFAPRHIAGVLVANWTCMLSVAVSPVMPVKESVAVVPDASTLEEEPLIRSDVEVSTGAFLSKIASTPSLDWSLCDESGPDEALCPSCTSTRRPRFVR